MISPLLTLFNDIIIIFIYNFNCIFIINEKYGSKLYDVHHYEQNGILYKERPSELEGYPTKIITNYDYEIQENEKKRKIKILYPHLLQQIENEVKALFI